MINLSCYRTNLFPFTFESLFLIPTVTTYTSIAVLKISSDIIKRIKLLCKLLIIVQIFALMDTTDVSPRLRPYLLLLAECLLESPVLREGELVPYEQVVEELEADTVVAVTRIGLESTSRFQCGPYCQTASLMLQVSDSFSAKHLISSL